MHLRHLSCALVAGTLIVSSAHAENPRVNTQVFRPSPHAYDLFSTVTSEMARQWDWTATLWASYATNTLVFVDLASDERQEVIADQLTFSAVGALNVTKWLSLGLEIPFFAINDGDDSGFVALDPVPSSALGDIRLSPKLGIVTRRFADNGIGLALEVSISLPTGDRDAFVSDGLTVTPAAVVDLRAGPLLLALNLGARLREDQDLALGNEVGVELVVRAAAAVDIVQDRLAVIGEINTASYDFSEDTSYLEGLIGGRLTLASGLTFTLAGGRGFTEGYGSTGLHVVGGVGWAPPRTRWVEPPPVVIPPPPDLDPDTDGVLDPNDKCPLVAEDIDQFEDDDGCPDPDNDHDGIPDAADKCPNEPEDKDAYQDDDGCPEPDNDGDGILDVDDSCPADAANKCNVTVDPCEIKIGETVYFEYDKATIDAKSFALLDAVAAVFLTRPNITKVEVQGHTDNEGEDAYNLTLSQQRADAVRDYLANKQVAVERLTAVGYGEAKPIASNKNAQGRAANRRVQFIILEPSQSGCSAPTTK